MVNHVRSLHGHIEVAITKKAVYPVRDRVRRPEYFTRCRRHPKLDQGPGVCSLCLSEKLSILFSKQKRGRIVLIRKEKKHAEEEEDEDEDEDEEEESLSSSPSVVSSCYSSSEASSCSSPNNIDNCLILPGERKEFRSLSSRFISRGKDVMTKSKSMAFGLRNKKETSASDQGRSQKQTRGFWSRLFFRATLASD